MYNRYIPQPDGSFRRSRIPDTANMQPVIRPPEVQSRESQDHTQQDCEPEIKPCDEECSQPSHNREHPRRNPHCRPNYRGQHPQHTPRQTHSDQKQERKSEQKDTSVSSFLRQLLPKDFDTGDLLIVLLLLLMSGDCAEDQNSALLTLVLYLFL